MVRSNTQHRAGKAIHDLFRELFQLHAALARIMDKVHEQAGLSTSQIRVMRALRRIGSGTVPDIAAELGVSRQFVQTVCNDLVEREYIAFRDNPRHKRSRLTALTDSGRRAFRRARLNEDGVIEKALPGVDPDQATAARMLLASIRKAVANISEDKS